jgi:3D (Asp-Asp-Asp) domain-containing protein
LVVLAMAVATLVLLSHPPSGGARRGPSISRLRALDAALVAKSRSALLNLYAIDSQLTAADAQLGALRERARILGAQRGRVELQVRAAARSHRFALERAAARLDDLYDYGSSASPLDIVLGADTVAQALTRLDDVADVDNADTVVIEQLHATQLHLAQVSHELHLRETELALTTRAASDTVAELEHTQAQRTSYLSDLQDQHDYTSDEITRLDEQVKAAQQRAAILAAQHQRALARAARAAALERAAVEASRPAATATSATTTTNTDVLTPTPTTTGIPVGSSAPSAAIPPAATTPAPPTAVGTQTITVVATGYDLAGTTATGIPVGYGVAAVDPSVIPLGSHMDIPGYGDAVAADTGGSIVGDRIDLWFPNAGLADAWGIRTVTIEVYL